MRRATLLLLICFSFSTLSLLAEEEVIFRSKLKKISINEDSIKMLGLKTMEIKEKQANEVLKTTGQIEEILYNKFDINSPVTGHVESVYIDLGDVVKVNQPLLVVKSTEIGMLIGDINQSKAELEFANSNFAREKSLYEQGISSKKDYDAAKASLGSTEAKSKALSKNLKILTNELDISNPDEYVLSAHKSGIISERNVNVGQVINPNLVLFMGVDLSTVWANADIYEKDINKIKPGQDVTVTLDGAPDKVFQGKISHIGSGLNKSSRTLPVKATLNNPDNELKPGAFIQLAIHTGRSLNRIVIPRTALVETDNEGTDGRHKHFVYVKEQENSFVPRKVEVEPHDSDSIEVVEGLAPEEIIVTKGAYQLQFEDRDSEENSFSLFKLNFKWFLIPAFVFGLLIILLFRKKRQA